MDNREAVNWLANVLADIGKAEHNDLWHYEQALTEIKDMLESAQPVATDTNVGDTISRQAAISAICNACGKIDCDKMDKCEKLQLPPANCSEFPNNSDTISRQAAIDALDKRFDSIPMKQTTEILLLRKDLRNLPSAQPERTGKWINEHWDGDSNFRIDGRGNCWYVRECSNCHEEIEGKPTNYCPYCGAKMMKDGD